MVFAISEHTSNFTLERLQWYPPGINRTPIVSMDHNGHTAVVNKPSHEPLNKPLNGASIESLNGSSNESLNGSLNESLNVSLTAASRFEVTHDASSSTLTLTILNATEDDRGNWTCEMMLAKPNCSDSLEENVVADGKIMRNYKNSPILFHVIQERNTL